MQNNENSVSEMPGSRRLQIALGLPEWQPFYQVMNNEPADATYVIQGNLSRGLMERGHTLTFMAPYNLEEAVFTSNPLKPRLAARTWTANHWFNVVSKGVWRMQRLLRIPYLNVFSNYRYWDAFLHSLSGIDLVYERNGLYNVGLALACRQLKIPYVMFLEADQIMELEIMGKPLSGLLRWRAQQLFRYNLRTADCIICVSEVGKHHLINAWHVPGNRILVFPNAVDVQKFKPDPEARSDVRKSLGVKANPLVMFVGNFFHWHDVLTLLDAFAQVAMTQPDARLVLVGDGERRQEMMKRAAHLRIDHAVQFIGLVPHADVPRYVAAADIAVVPYPPMQQEMWLSPLKLFEYMASGKAIVASAVGQLTEVIQNGRNGLLVPPGDTSALASALVDLIGDAHRRSQLGELAREDAERMYSWENYLSRLERVFSAVISHQPVAGL